MKLLAIFLLIFILSCFCKKNSNEQQPLFPDQSQQFEEEVQSNPDLIEVGVKPLNDNQKINVKQISFVAPETSPLQQQVESQKSQIAQFVKPEIRSDIEKNSNDEMSFAMQTKEVSSKPQTDSYDFVIHQVPSQVPQKSAFLNQEPDIFNKENQQGNQMKIQSLLEAQKPKDSQVMKPSNEKIQYEQVRFNKKTQNSEQQGKEDEDGEEKEEDEFDDQNDGNLLSKMVVRGKKITMFMENLVDKEIVTKDDLKILKTIIDYFKLLQERVNKSDNQNLIHEYEFQFEQLKDQLQIIKEENLKIYNESEVDKQLAVLSQDKIDFQKEKEFQEDQALEQENNESAENSDDELNDNSEQKDISESHDEETDVKSEDDHNSDNENKSDNQDQILSDNDDENNSFDDDELSDEDEGSDQDDEDESIHIPIEVTNQENIIQSENSMRSEENQLMRELDKKKIELSKAIQELNSDKNGKNAEEDLIEIQKLDVDVQSIEKKLRTLYEQTDGFHSQAADQMTEELNHSPMLDLAAVKQYVEDQNSSSEENLDGSDSESSSSSSEIEVETKGELLDLIKKHHQKHKKNHAEVKDKIQDMENFKVEVLELLGQLANQSKKEEESSDDEKYESDSQSDEQSNEENNQIQPVVEDEISPESDIKDAKSKMHEDEGEEYTLKQVMDEDAAHPSDYKIIVSDSEMAHIKSQVQDLEGKKSSEKQEESSKKEEESSKKEEESSEEKDESSEEKDESSEDQEESLQEEEKEESSSEQEVKEESSSEQEVKEESSSSEEELKEESSSEQEKESSQEEDEQSSQEVKEVTADEIKGNDIQLLSPVQITEKEVKNEISSPEQNDIQLLSPVQITEKEVKNEISSPEHQEIRDAHNEIIQQQQENLENKTENVNQLSNYFAQFKKNISATKDKMLTSLKTGFEELEMELKDLIDHSTKDLNEQLVTERKKIQSTKQMLKKVLMKELDGEGANLLEEAAVNRFEQIQPKTDDEKLSDSFKNTIMSKQESEEDEKKVNFIFNDSFIKLKNGIITNDKVKVMDGVYRVNQLLKIVLNIKKQDENKIFQEVVKFEKGLTNECGGQILIMIFKLFRDMFAITDENYKSSKYDHMKQVITDKTEEILHEVENAIKLKKVKCQEKNEDSQKSSQDQSQEESFKQQDPTESQQKESQQILKIKSQQDEQKQPDLINKVSKSDDKVIKNKQKDLQNEVDSEISQRLLQLAQNDQEEDELMKELTIS